MPLESDMPDVQHDDREKTGRTAENLQGTPEHTLPTDFPSLYSAARGLLDRVPNTFSDGEREAVAAMLGAKLLDTDYHGDPVRDVLAAISDTGVQLNGADASLVRKLEGMEDGAKKGEKVSEAMSGLMTALDIPRTEETIAMANRIDSCMYTQTDLSHILRYVAQLEGTLSRQHIQFLRTRGIDTSKANRDEADQKVELDMMKGTYRSRALDRISSAVTGRKKTKEEQPFWMPLMSPILRKINDSRFPPQQVTADERQLFMDRMRATMGDEQLTAVQEALFRRVGLLTEE